VKIQYRTLAAIIASVGLAPTVNGDIISTQRFEVDGLVIVWSADAAGNAPVAVDFLIDGDANADVADVDLIADDAFTVVTGTLNSTNNNIGVGGFPLDFTGSPTVDSSTPRTSFYVASNTPFNISAEITDVQVDPVFTAFSNAFLGFVDLEMEVAPVGAARTDGSITYGSAAQPPHSGGEQAGFSSPIDLLDLVNTPTNVFSGNQRTAATPGSIADQSVRFDISYPLVGATIGGYDLSLGVVNFGVTVEYTVFVP